MDYRRRHQHTLSMPRFSPPAVRRATLILSAFVLAAALPAVSEAKDTSRPAELATLARDSVAGFAFEEAAQDDTAAVQRELRKSIERFQDTWRKAWQKVEI